MSTARNPQDDEERRRFAAAVERGESMTIEEWLEEYFGEPADEELVNEIRSILRRNAELGGEPVDIEEEVARILEWRNSVA